MLLIFVLVALFLFIRSETQDSLLGFKTVQFDLEKGQWIVLFGVFGAMTGWLISSIVAIRNSIRQHTMNILMQSRLSQTYVERAAAVYSRYFHPLGMRYLTEEEVLTDAPEAQLPALRYILSYLEFIAVGIRYGDLDEKLMRRTLRDLVCSLYEASGALFTVGAGPGAGDAGSLRRRATPTTLDNLSWLYEYWYDARLQRPRVLVRKDPANGHDTTFVEVMQPRGPRQSTASDA